MSVIARFEVIPVREGSMSTAIAHALRALDRHPVTYQTTATDTIIEADTVEQVFAAVGDAHRAIPDDRVITSLEVDEDRRRQQHIGERVAAVERALGRPPQRQRPVARGPAGQQPPAGEASTREPVAQQPPARQLPAQRPPAMGR